MNRCFSYVIYVAKALMFCIHSQGSDLRALFISEPIGSIVSVLKLNYDDKRADEESLSIIEYNSLIQNADDLLLMSTYYSGEDENRKKQKEELTPKRDISGSTFSEEKVDSSNTDKNQATDAAESADSKDAGEDKQVKQIDLDAEEPE